MQSEMIQYQPDPTGYREIARPSAGWYPDPWRVDALRWWNGQWAQATLGTTPQRRAQARHVGPDWVIWPVTVCAPMVAIVLGLVALRHMSAVALGFAPLLIVLPCMAWAERGAPHDPKARLAAVAWGATVAVVLAVLVETVLGAGLSRAALVGVAGPAVEEAAKGLGLWIAFRRRDIESVLDGIVVAAWVAVGFAAVEDVGYFAKAGPAVAGVFVARAIITPFAHPLFTMWTGAILGLAAQRGWRRPFVWAGGGWVVAFSLHMAWNETLLHSTSGHSERVAVLLAATALFIAVFTGAVVWIACLRRQAVRQLERMVPWFAGHYRLSPFEVGLFADRRAMGACRRQLPASRRPRFDAELGALGHLAQLWDGRPPDSEARERFWAERLRVTRAA